MTSPATSCTLGALEQDPPPTGCCPQARAQATTQPNLLQVPQHLRCAFASDAVQGEPGLRDALQEFRKKIPKFEGSF